MIDFLQYPPWLTISNYTYFLFLLVSIADIFLAFFADKVISNQKSKHSCGIYIFDKNHYNVVDAIMNSLSLN